MIVKKDLINFKGNISVLADPNSYNYLFTFFALKSFCYCEYGLSYFCAVYDYVGKNILATAIATDLKRKLGVTTCRFRDNEVSI